MALKNLSLNYLNLFYLEKGMKRDPTNYYDSIAKGYDELYYEEQIQKWERAKELLTIKDTDKILDVGCGTGIITYEIYKKTKNVWGIDRSKQMLELAKKQRPGPKYLLGDATALPFKDKEFDKVVSFTMLQDMSVEERRRALSEVARCCKDAALITLLKRNKNLDGVMRELSNYFYVRKVVEETKDYIFLLAPKK